MEQQLIQKDKKKAKELTEELEKFHEFCKQVAKQLNGMVKDVASKQWAMGKILVDNRKKAEKVFSKNLLPLFYMDIARATGQDLSPHTLQDYALFYERIPNLASRIKASDLPVMIYKIISQNESLLPQINELEKRYQKGEWKTVKEFYEWVYPEKELTAIDMVNRFHNGFATWRANTDEFLNMNLGDLDSTDTELLLTDIGVQMFETLPKLAKRIVEETGAKPNERIMRLLKLSKE